ncbi:AAA family ATPase [Psychrobium sp. MM17-31]|uniref:AAA family ATPase n=1 Tax=Psychrobium sp. MM17-31 TaxID=2917758 RepID=UPI001EF4B5F4|nr:AAA family ATPase [Psychrobium sp. MM17-31]MCG7531458.1 AAA family ATPase [Psychrobium sp. MM17-31]
MKAVTGLTVNQIGFNQQRAQTLLENHSWLDAIGLSLGQERAQNAFKFFATQQCSEQHMVVLGYPAIDSKALIRELLLSNPLTAENVFDVVYCEDVTNPRKPICLNLPAGQGVKFTRLVHSWLKRAALLVKDNPESEEKYFTVELEPLLKVFKRLPKVLSFLNDLAKNLDNGYALSHPVLVNNFVSHEADDSFPIVFCDNPNSIKLFGDIAQVTEQGTTVANHHLLQPGLLHQANGGVLVLPSDRLLENPQLWFELKSSLFDRQIKWTSANHWLDPQAIDLKTQIILVGDALSYRGLLDLDPDITQLFPLVAEVNHQFALDDDKDYVKYAGFLQNISRRAGCNELSREALVALMNYSSFLIEHHQRMSLDSALLKSLIQQAQVFANGNEHIESSHIIEAINAYNHRKNRVAQYSFEAIKDKQLLLVTEGKQIGQINALSVLDTDLDSFGEPSRVTAAVYYGDGDIGDVERKVDQAGNIHAKGVAILTSYLHQKFAMDDEIPLDANLVFEQSYQGIDGDSAAMASLLCLLSAFAKKPLHQGIAVTGAMDQFGNILAIGGVNEKIVGFFNVCQANGFKDNQGVIIPKSNIANLNLPDEIIAAIESGQFAIYPVEHIEQAIALSFGLTAGEADDNGEYPADSVYGAIAARIEEINNPPQAPESFLSRLKFW